VKTRVFESKFSRHLKGTEYSLIAENSLSLGSHVQIFAEAVFLFCEKIFEQRGAVQFIDPKLRMGH
jgi:hypothetical protein